jgi:hypothetical protein
VILTVSNLRNNSLSGCIPDSFAELNRLVYLDLSINHLTGPFPEWVHNLKSLSLLNLGQNDLSGEIPLVIRKKQNDGGRQLNSVREFINLLGISDSLFRYRDRDGSLQLKFKSFLRQHPYIMDGKDLLWIDSERSYWDPINLKELIDVYIKAEEDRLLTKIYQSIRKLDPMRLMEAVNSVSTQPKIMGVA